jgi:N-terminal of Par3 and HAL proteins
MSKINTNDNWTITAYVCGKNIVISCGDGSQTVKWLGNVAIARWDDSTCQGWKKLGAPISIRHQTKEGVELDMSSSINEVIQNGDRVYIFSSLQPHEAD